MIARAICIVLSLAVVSTAYATELTEKTVRQVISKVDHAVNELSARAVAEQLSGSVSITINISIQGQKQVMTPSKQEYVSMLEQGWAQYTNYKCSRSNVVTKIKHDKAYVSADIQESMTIHGQYLSGASKEEVIIELVNGKPLITEMVGYTSM